MRAKAGADADEGHQEPAADTKKKGKNKGAITGTVAALAAKLNAKTGADLTIAPAAQLTLVEGKESYKREELLKAMRSATSYYKQTYSSNFSVILKGLLSAGRLTEPAGSTYAVTAPERHALEGKLSA